MEVNRIEFIGSLDQIDEIKNALLKLPDNIIYFENPTGGKSLSATKGGLGIEIYPNEFEKVQNIKVPKEAQNIRVSPKWVAFEYQKTNYTISYTHRIDIPTKITLEKSLNSDS